MQILYVPHLRRESVSFCPDCVEFLSSGLAASAKPVGYAKQTSQEDTGCCEEKKWLSPLLPYTPAQAKHVLNDLLSYGLNMGLHGDMQAMAVGMADAQRSTKARRTSRSELRDIDQFEQGLLDKASAKVDDLDAQEQTLITLQNAQKTLLLAEHLEESAIEIDTLRDHFSHGRESLLDTLGVEEDLTELLGVEDMSALPDQEAFTAELLGSGLDVLRPSWRVLLDSMMHFIPKGAVLFTSDATMLEAMHEAGLAFEPMKSADFVAMYGVGGAHAGHTDLLPDGAQLMRITAPVWLLLGHKAPIEGRPWLNRMQTLFAVQTA